MALAPLSQTLVLTENGAVVTPTTPVTIPEGPIAPAPSFTTQPSIGGTPRVGEALILNDGSVADGTINTREVLLDGTPVGATYAPLTGDVGKSVAYRTTATGAGGTTSATSASRSVAAAAVAAPALIFSIADNSGLLTLILEDF